MKTGANYFFFVVVLRFSQVRPGFEIQEQSLQFLRIINSMMVRISFFNACSSLISTHLLLVNFLSRKHAFIQEHFSSFHFEECQKFRLSGKFSLHSNSKLRYSLKNKGDILKSKFKWRFKKSCVIEVCTLVFLLTNSFQFLCNDKSHDQEPRWNLT